MKQLRIAIVGYGTAGQAAAVWLSRDGHDVSVFGRGQMLRVLTGTQRGLVGRLGLEEAFVDALGSAGLVDWAASSAGADAVEAAD